MSNVACRSCASESPSVLPPPPSSLYCVRSIQNVLRPLAESHRIIGPAALLQSGFQRRNWVNVLCVSNSGTQLLTGDSTGCVRHYVLPQILGAVPSQQKERWRCQSSYTTDPRISEFGTVPVSVVVISFLSTTSDTAVVAFESLEAVLLQLGDSRLTEINRFHTMSKVEAMCVTRNSVVLVAGGEAVKAIEPFSGTVLHSFRGEQLHTHVALLPGDLMATCNLYGTVSLWKLGKPLTSAVYTKYSDEKLTENTDAALSKPSKCAKLIRRTEVSEMISAMTVLPHSMAAVSGHMNGFIYVHSLHDDLAQTTQLHGHTDAVTSIAGVRDDRFRSFVWESAVEYLPSVLVSLVLDYCAQNVLVTGSADGTARSWDLSSNQCLSVSQRLPAEINHITLLAGGTLCALALLNKSVWLWDHEANTFPARFEGHTDDVWRVQGLPDSRCLLSSSVDVLAWDMRGFTVRCSFKGCVKKADAACSRCRVALYCSRQHQVSDWKSHKTTCAALRG